MNANNTNFVNLTADQCNTLICYILLTAGYRKEEREAWEKLAQEKTSDGQTMFPKAAYNAKYYAELDQKLEEIKRIIEASY